MTTRRNFLKQSLLAAGAASVPAGNLLAQEKMEEKRPKYNLPYKNTYLKEPFVTENEFRTAKPETITPGTFEEAKQILPDPTWSGHEKEIEMYWKAWQIGIGNIKAPEPDSGFVCSYLDVAYNGNIFMWDSAFMMMFARFGTRFFPFQRTLDNFYAKQHPDGFICREIKADGADCFERYDPTSTGPNILPWSEIVYYKQFGDIDRLHKIFPALCAYYKWLKLNHTWRNGTYWTSGWGTGMDNMPRVEPKYNPIYSHGHMIWLDVCLQQYFTAGHLLEMGFYLERWQEIEEFEDEPFDAAPYFDDSRFSDDDFTDDGALSPEAQMRALADMQRAIVREELAPVLEAREQERRDREATALEQRYPELADEQTAVRYVQEGVQAAEALGNPALAREPAFLEMVYLAAKARERAGQEIPAGSAPGVTLETGPGGSPAPAQGDEDAAKRIVAAGRRGGFRSGA